MIRKLLFTVLLQFILFYAIAQSDSLETIYIQGVTITEKAIKRELNAVNPLQILDREKIEHLNILQLSDAVKFFSGVTVKDYGGIGGLKTVSVRGLGATHTAVSYNGISIADASSGQVDLGKFSLNNVSRITLSTGNNDMIFRAARLFASAAVLDIQASDPELSEEQKISIEAAFKVGSFGLYNPQISFAGYLNKSFSVTANIEYLRSCGDYPYTLHYGASSKDSSSRERRENSEIETWRAETSLFGYFKKGGQLRTDVYFYQSEQGLPNATIFYTKAANQRLWEQFFFIQAHYQQTLNRYFTIQTNGKYSRSFQLYQNSDYLGNDEPQKNNYYQNEGYGSTTLLYQPFEQYSFSLANDLIYNYMDANLPSFANPDRYTWYAVLAGKYSNRFITATANILSAIIREKVHYGSDAANSINYGKKAPDSDHVSPALSMAFRPLKNEELSLRLMFKEIFRMPTFNDLYYSRVGNPNLKPESAWQYNAGITWGKKITGWIPWISVIADGYYNKVENKIIAIPTKNIFEWSMQNIGKVDIYGIDLNLDVHFKGSQKYNFFIKATYSFQKALDVTSKTDPIYSKLYKHQIPYTPEHSGGGSFSFENPFVNIIYTVLYSGSRYVLGQNIMENYLQPYADQSLAFGKEIKWGKVLLTANFEILNIFDEQYEVIRYFPMQGRSYRITLKGKF